MMPNEPVVAVVLVAVTPTNMLTVDDVAVVAVVAVEAVGVVPVVVSGVLTVDSDAVVKVLGVNVLSAKHINNYNQTALSSLEINFDCISH